MPANPSTDGNPAPAARGGRWIRPDLAAVPCGARTRAGTPCRAPAVRGRRRCRMHGGAPGSGAPRGNRNALRHGWWSAAARAERQHVAALIEEAERALEALAEAAAGAGETATPRAAGRPRPRPHQGPWPGPGPDP